MLGGLTAAGVIAYVAYKSSQPPQGIVTVAPGSVTATQYTSGLTVELPPNASWVSTGGSYASVSPGSKNAVTMYGTAPYSESFAWTDANGQQQSTTVNVTA